MTKATRGDGRWTKEDYGRLAVSEAPARGPGLGRPDGPDRPGGPDGSGGPGGPDGLGRPGGLGGPRGTTLIRLAKYLQ